METEQHVVQMTHDRNTEQEFKKFDPVGLFDEEEFCHVTSVQIFSSITRVLAVQYQHLIRSHWVTTVCTTPYRRQRTCLHLLSAFVLGVNGIFNVWDVITLIIFSYSEIDGTALHLIL